MASRCYGIVKRNCAGPGSSAPDLPNAPLGNGATILHEVVTTGSHVTNEEHVLFATVAFDAGARSHR
jgi:hypothetical protein